MDTKITQEPLIASQIIKHVLGQNPQGGVTINVVTIGTVQVGSHSQDNSIPLLPNKRARGAVSTGVRCNHVTREDLAKALEQCDWKTSLVAEKLGMSVMAVRSRIIKLGLKKHP